MEETNSPSVAHVSYDISPLSRVKFKIVTTRLTDCGHNFKFNSLEWRNIVTHRQLKENLYFYHSLSLSLSTYISTPPPLPNSSMQLN
jgi:hypothetical protein